MNEVIIKENEIIILVLLLLVLEDIVALIVTVIAKVAFNTLNLEEEAVQWLKHVAARPEAVPAFYIVDRGWAIFLLRCELLSGRRFLHLPV